MEELPTFGSRSEHPLAVAYCSRVERSKHNLSNPYSLDIYNVGETIYDATLGHGCYDRPSAPNYCYQSPQGLGIRHERHWANLFGLMHPHHGEQMTLDVALAAVNLLVSSNNEQWLKVEITPSISRYHATRFPQF